MSPRLKALLWIGAAVVAIGAVMSSRTDVAPKKPAVRNSVYGPETPRDRGQSAPAKTAKSPTPFIKVTVDRLDYETGGYMKVLGKAENTGAAAAFSPTIKLQVLDSSGKTILVDTSTWPAGQYLKSMSPGTSAAFELFTRVAGDPGNIKWRLWVAEYDHDVIKPKR